ncbi:MAG: DUF934 domain-containing protein [Alphaproteobacteria bacterium]|nr:DUF934 domain-containing protein [Alphaproteobacteria bacterium]
MPLLDHTGLIPDRFTRADLATLSAVEAPLVPWLQVRDAVAVRRPNQALGVAIPNTVAATDVAPLLPHLALIAIDFPSFADGRGFSLAHHLRRDGFQGRLRAVGPVIADQFAYARACGFDEVEPTDAVLARQPVEVWMAALAAISHTYQPGFTARGASILERRRASQSQVGAAA